MMRVFISSTCYDLTDLRAELEAFFKGAGVEPVLSDSLTSDFQVTPDANSIETCLANVRSCEHFIIILSNRYGPTLEKAGYDAVSATHLEYIEARKNNIPVHMYVRDRLEADFAIWRANGAKSGLKLSWCKSEKDWPIFKLLEEHRKLQEAGGNNWLWTFRNSIELKDRLARDFKEAFANAAIRALSNSGNLPLFEVEIIRPYFIYNSAKFIIHLRNVGLGVAVSPEIRVGPDLSVNTLNRWPIKTLHPRENTEIPLEWALKFGTKLDLPTRLTYSTLQGYMLADEGNLSIWSEVVSINPKIPKSGASYALKERRYLGISTATILKTPVPET